MSNQQRGLRAPAPAIRRMVTTLDESALYPVPQGELSIVFLGANEMGLLHDRFLGDPAPTDVLTFPQDPMSGSAGEICVCPDVAWGYAQSHGKDFASELALYIVHGYLHLSGQDDTNPKARRSMRRAEKRSMACLEAANALPAFEYARR